MHLFVFYFGIMGDITPPVGLATFAAAAISGEDPIETGIQGSVYALRTVVLPFVFIFNPMLLMIDVRLVGRRPGGVRRHRRVLHLRRRDHGVVPDAASGGRSCCCSSRPSLFRPDFFMDRMYAPYTEVPAKEVFKVATELPEDDRLVLVIQGTNVEGEDVKKTVAVQLGAPGDGRKRLAEAGLTISALGPEVTVSAVKFGSRAKKSGFEQGFKVAAVKVPSDRPSEHWVYIPALALVALVWFLQRARERPDRKRQRAAA